MRAIHVKLEHENIHNLGLLQPVPVPEQAWLHLAMDFIEQLPLSNKNNTIWVVVDRFTKYSHFIALAHPFTALSLASLLIDTIY